MGGCLGGVGHRALPWCIIIRLPASPACPPLLFLPALPALPAGDQQGGAAHCCLPRGGARRGRLVPAVHRAPAQGGCPVYCRVYCRGVLPGRAGDVLCPLPFPLHPLSVHACPPSRLPFLTEVAAACCCLLRHIHPPALQVSIVPRGSAALGFAQYLPNENMLMTTEQVGGCQGHHGWLSACGGWAWVVGCMRQPPMSVPALGSQWDAHYVLTPFPASPPLSPPPCS